MRHLEITDDLRSTAALFSLGALDGAELQAFEAHLAEGCEICRAECDAFGETAAQLPLAAVEHRPPDSLRTRLLARTAAPATAMHVLRSTEGKWVPTPFPGVSVKRLYLDRENAMATHLVRMAPGASYPPHRHTAVEQCLVLEGDIQLNETRLGPGDYSRNDAFSTHQRIQTENGCLFLIIASLEDELLA
jgi:anti-sigma factor ChrR (cupin superfamily)